ncbi:MAG: hypothetical protein WKF49_07840 [Thermoleophilaceae bacterium]
MRAPETSLCALCAGLLILAGCGNDRPAVIEEAPAPSTRTRDFRSARAGLEVQLPANLQVVAADRPPAVFRATLGQPFVSSYAYRRKEQLPRDAKELDDARKRLATAVRRRDAGYRLASSRSTEVDGARAVELVGEQTISRRRVRIRSLHVFKGEAEYVVEIVAPSAGFSRFDRRLTPLVKRTLKVTGRVRGS